MFVNIDKPGSDNAIPGVNGYLGGSDNISHSCDPVSDNADIGDKGSSRGSIVNRTIADYDIICYV
jgi:hypothetical protein